MKPSTKKVGDWGEDLAAEELEKAGYKIIDRNFRTRFGEIDIIAEDGDTLIFVEVKAKSSIKYGTPAEMITKTKQHKLKLMSEYYISEKNYKGPWRIDAVTILGDKFTHKIEILKNIIPIS